MKYILIAVFMSLVDPSTPAIFTHDSFDSKAMCEMGAEVGKAAVAEKPELKNIKIMTFCVSEADLLDVNNV